MDPLRAIGGDMKEEYGVIVYTWHEFEEDARKLARMLKESNLLDTIDALYGIPRGGLPLASRLGYILDLPVVERFEITERTLIVDDIADTGRTLNEILTETPARYTATLFYNPISIVEPTFWVRLKWVVFPWADEDLARLIAKYKRQ